MPNLFALAEQALCSPDVETKLAITHQAWQCHETGELGLDSEAFPPLAVNAARFPDRPRLVDPRKLPRRRLDRTEGRVALLHAVAHIEFSAIQLAFDHLYRFRGLPNPYYFDWLGVAEEEARHFEMIRERLRELGADYGDLPAHGGLWGIARDTADDVLARMALVPRFMEARGLDVTPAMMAKLENAGDAVSVAVLERILHDEVGHVALGTQWFRWICDQRGLNPEEEYFVLIERHMKGQARGPFNLELRRLAGFSEAELSRLSGSAG
ncbi:MAG: ferritin-like domain-containing protein [Methylococcaceae bacterium]|nr:ferritin-like domain-containing protein [Methylococcaceae bacterium]